MVKSLRIKHYSYLVLALLLVVLCIGNIIASLRTAKAAEDTVTITSPTANQEVNQDTQQITGTAPALKEVVVFDGTTRIGTTTSSAGGTWSLAWEEPTPGKHSLRATVTDGVLYSLDPLSQYSVKARSVNTDQVLQNYAAGLSGSSGIVFDEGLQKNFVINYYAGTISQVNPISREIEETIVYDSSSTRSSLTGGQYYSLCTVNQMVKSVCAYTFSQQSHKLYLLDNTKLYIINVQNRNVESTIDVGKTDDSDYAPVGLEYRLYLNPQSNYLYIYHHRLDTMWGTWGINNLKRINLQSGVLESEWTKPDVNSVVSSAAGDVFYADSTLHVLRANSETTADISIPDGTCDQGVYQLALAKDESFLYAACKDSSGNKKIAVVSMSDGQVVTTFDREGDFLSEGNLLSEKLLIAQNDTTIQVLDTTSNSFASSIQSIVGTFQKNSLQIDPANEKAYFATLDSSTSLNHLYEVNLASSGITHDFTNPITDFSGVRSATITTLGSYDFIPVEANESVHSLSLNDGAHSYIESGVGSAGLSIYSESSHRLFTIPGQGPLGYTNKITASSTDDASFQGKVALPGNYIVATTGLNEDGSVLYVLGAELNQSNVLEIKKAFAIDVNTLQVTHVYNTLGQYTYDTSRLISKLIIKNNKLVFSDSSTLYLLNLSNDTSETSPLTPSEQDQNSLISTGLWSTVAFNSDGTKIAVIRDDKHISVRSSNDLHELFQISKASNNLYTLAEVYFDQSDNILTTSGSLAAFGSDAMNIERYSGSTGEFIHTIRLPTPTASGLWVCFPVVSYPSLSEQLLSLTALCVNFIGQNQERPGLYTYVADLQTDTTVHIKKQRTVDSLTAAGVPTVADVHVSSVTQNVTVRADAVTITNPDEGEQVQAGMRKIIGTAPPNASLNIFIDNQNIGTAQADQYGAWNIDHEFIVTKNYQIKAEYVRPSKQVQYLPFMELDISQYPNLTYKGQIKVFNTVNNKVESEFTLPDDNIPLFLEVSNDHSKVYAIGMKILNFDSQGDTTETSNMTLFTIDPNSNQVISSAVIPGTSAHGADSLALAFGQSVLSSDQEHIITVSSQNLRIFNRSGVLEKTIPASESPAAEGEYLKKIISNDNTGTVIVATSKRLLFVNTVTNDVQITSLPDDTYLSSIQYSSKYQKIVGAIGITGQPGILVSGTNTMGDPNQWITQLNDFTALPDAFMSKDGEHLFLFGTNQDGTVGTLDFKISDGTYTTRFTQPGSSDIISYTSGMNDMVQQGLPYRFAPDVTGTKVYAPAAMYMPAQVFKPFENVAPQTITTWGSSSYSLYINSSNKIATEISGATLTATRGFSVIKNAAEPPQPPRPPEPPQPPQPPNPPEVVTATAKENKKQLITQAEKRALRKSPFTSLFAGTKKIFKGIPWSILRSFPYFMYTILLALAGYYLFQTQKMLRREDRMRSILGKQKVLTEEKRNFLELTSHYLRTPLTYIRSGVEISSRREGRSEQLASDMAEAVNHLSLFVESLIEEAGLAKNEVETKPVTIESPLLSRTFLLPALGLTLVVGLFYVLATGVVGMRFEAATYLTHILLTFLVIRVFYGMLKNHRLMIAENKQIKEVLEVEKQLDHSRSKLLEDAGEQLKTRTDHIAGLSSQLTDDETSRKIIQQGVDRLQELARAFRLVCKLEVQTLVPQMQPVSVKTLASEVIEPFQQQLAEKNLKLNVVGFKESITLTTNKPLVELTLKSLIENAVQASKEGGNLVVKCLSSDGHVAFQVIDHGEGIPKEKLDQLFKPFVRIGPVTTFNREGIGLSLFLDRLIMHSLGGEVEIMSKFEQGTTATLTFKQKLTA